MHNFNLDSFLQPDRFHSHDLGLPGSAEGIKQNVEKIIIPKKILDPAVKALSSSKLETLVFLMGKVKGSTLLATDVLIPEEHDYATRSYINVKTRDTFIAEKILKLENQGKITIASIHSHGLNTLSQGDKETHLKVVKFFYPHFLTGIFNEGKITFFKVDGKLKKVPYEIIDLERFSRQISIFGEEGQLLISTTTIALIGCGGGNTKIAFDLASLGAGKLILIDPDVWEESNRNRVLIPPEHVGMAKVESVKRIIEKHYPEVEVEAYKARVEDVEEEVLSKADLWVVGPDRLLTREYCNRLALKLKKKAVFVGAGIKVEEGRVKDMGGSVQVVIPGKTPCFECVHTPDPLTVIKETSSLEVRKKLSKKYGVALDVDVNPSIVCLNDVIAGLAIQEIIKLVTGFDKPVCYKIYDALNDEIRRVKVSRDPECPACGKKAEVIDGKEIEKQTKSEEDILSLEKGKGECSSSRF